MDAMLQWPHDLLKVGLISSAPVGYEQLYLMTRIQRSTLRFSSQIAFMNDSVQR